MTNNWVDFYMEFADKLLTFKSDRKTLVKKLQKSCKVAGLNYPTLAVDDIDPFTAITMFNKFKKYEASISLMNALAEEFEIEAEVPDDYAGPIMIPLSAIFFYTKGERDKDDIDNLWDFFDAAMIYSDSNTEANKKRFVELYDRVIVQKGVKWNLTMALYWSRPYVFLSLDSTNRNYINNYNMLDRKLTSPPSGEEYLKIITKIRSELDKIDSENGVNDFVEFTAWTWAHSNEPIGSIGEEENFMDIAKNTILYGPPGTGKTYSTVLYAVAIIEGRSLEEIRKEDYYFEVLQRYNKYKSEGRIEFTTFHQSYGYEEFIEGIKPVMQDCLEMSDDSDMDYKIEAGSFKSFCDKIINYVPEETQDDYGINSDPTVWKVSLQRSGENPTRTQCMKKGIIRVGFDGYGESISDKNLTNGKKVLEYFINEMAIGDIVVSCYDAKHFDAIGVITGEYEWHNEYENLKRVRSVNWLVKDLEEEIEPITGVKFTLSTVYKLHISSTDILKVVDKYMGKTDDRTNDDRNYVYIIDEINRGNISKIFGELITLIEENKRIDEWEECKVRLPYSKQLFGVPNNLYILGTMNTADRSISQMDTALRRRFDFREILPDPDVLDSLEVDGISISIMLETINQRISVLYDREHTIGHAYFMSLFNDDSLENLADIFKNKIMPLLQEYFYDNYQKIRWVLGDNQKQNKQDQFVLKQEVDVQELFGDADLGDEVTYEINREAFYNPDAYIGIYEN